MKKSLFASLFIFIFTFSVAEAGNFSFSVPSQEQMLTAIAEASAQTKIRTALLYGLLGQETAYGGNLGKTESQWNNFCSTRNTEDCRNWRNYDCKPDYRNARHLDDILRALDYTDKSQIPFSSTCALGFTQFEPNTWWQVIASKGTQNLNPWNIKDAVLMAAYYLQDLGADKNEILGPNDVIGQKDRIALQRYYCGGNYARPECVWYAQGVEAKARRAPVATLQKDFQNQLNTLRERQSDLRKQLKLKKITPSPSAQAPSETSARLPSKPLLIETLGGLPHAVEGVYYSVRITVTKESNQNIGWSIDSGNLLPGLTLDSKTGVISGTPSAGSRGNYVFTIKILDDFGLVDTRPMSITVEIPELPLSITTPELLEGATQSLHYETNLSASGGTPPYQWSVVSGSLPPGINLDSSGYISGRREETAGNYEFGARVVDYREKSDEKTFRLTVYSRPAIPDKNRFPEGMVGTPFSLTLPVNGGVPPYTWTIIDGFPENEAPPSRVWNILGGPPDKELSLSERNARSSSFLPAGLRLDSSSGVISGKPTESTALGFNAMVTDSRGVNDKMSFYITIMLSSKPITNDASADFHPIVLRRQNGDLITFFKTYKYTVCPPAGSPCKDFSDREEGIYTALSSDDGKNWSAPQPIVKEETLYWPDYAAVTEDRNGDLVLLVILGDDMFTLTSPDGRRWTNQRRVTPVKQQDRVIGSILHAKDGYYYVGYHSEITDGKKADSYLTRSRDLVTWEDPIQISRGSDSEFYPELFQTTDGKFYAAYSSYTDKEITIAESLDGKNWTVSGHVKTDPVFANMGLNFVEMEGRLVLLFYGGIGGTSYYSFLKSGVWSSPVKFYLDASYRLDGVVLKDGSLGLAHIYYTDYYRDIYFANIAKLKF